MNRLPNDINIHTHAGPPRSGVIVNVDPVTTLTLPDGDGSLSVGIHPWNAAFANDDVWRRMETFLDDPRVVAVGECGLDRAKGPSVADVQLPVFEQQATMAARRDMPLIIHCVRATDMLLGVRKKLHPENQWIYHGFRGKPTQAQQLLAAGIDLSYGLRYDDESRRLTPPTRRYAETD